MSQPDGKLRPWREIAREVAREENPMKILALSKELDEAIAAQGTGPEVEPFPNQRDGKAPEHLPE